ncbi:MAG: non-canonical purine NTP pyrophosphatase [Polyangiales bacterium]
MTGEAPAAQWVLASHNEGKLRELGKLFANVSVRLYPARNFDLPEPEETGATFEDNATLKAVAAMNATGLAAVSDDSGVEVDALGGDPGIHTARWAGPDRDFALARRRVHDQLAALGPTASHRATWVSVLCLASPTSGVATFRGERRGTLVWPARHPEGFGFEPVFLPDGYAVTYAEMHEEQKLVVNARAAAMRKLREAMPSIAGT